VVRQLRPLFVRETVPERFIFPSPDDVVIGQPSDGPGCPGYGRDQRGADRCAYRSNRRLQHGTSRNFAHDNAPFCSLGKSPASGAQTLFDTIRKPPREVLTVCFKTRQILIKVSADG